MKYKKVIIIVGALLLALSIAFFTMASGDKPPKDKEMGGEIVYKGWLRSWEGVNLVLSSHQGPSTDAYKVIAKEFEELTGATVQVIDESWTDLLGKHLAAAAAGTAAYDIITFPYIWFGHYVEGDLVENLNDWFAMTDLVDPNYGMDDWIPAIQIQMHSGPFPTSLISILRSIEQTCLRRQELSIRAVRQSHQKPGKSFSKMRRSLQRSFRT
jgi:ABC-type glycerol-3-phosphate transport system substrate-binding protein